MDAADRRSVDHARDAHHARPAARAVVVSEVGTIEQVFRRWVREAAGPEIGLRRAACEGPAAVKNAADLKRVVGLGPRREHRPVHVREAGRLLEERAVGEPGGVSTGPARWPPQKGIGAAVSKVIRVTSVKGVEIPV